LECYILNLEIREIVIKDKPRTLKKFKAVDLKSNKFINAEIWNLENIINNNDKCLIKYALFQLGNKAVLTNTDYLSITVIESNVNLTALKLESSTTITTKIKTYANFETFATSSEQVANLTGNTNILTL
jgi:hypothetical protein